MKSHQGNTSQCGNQINNPLDVRVQWCSDVFFVTLRFMFVFGYKNVILTTINFDIPFYNERKIIPRVKMYVFCVVKQK